MGLSTKIIGKLTDLVIHKGIPDSVNIILLLILMECTKYHWIHFNVEQENVQIQSHFSGSDFFKPTESKVTK